jgi:hypothetical protein
VRRLAARDDAAPAGTALDGMLAEILSFLVMASSFFSFAGRSKREIML